MATVVDVARGDNPKERMPDGLRCRRRAGQGAPAQGEIVREFTTIAA
jgi:hypothetical protein